MANYPVQQPSRTNFSEQEIADICVQFGPSLLCHSRDIDGPQLFWAISGVESGFGSNCTPRHETGYCTGKMSRSPAVVELTKRVGHAAHASFGPFQLMAVNTPGFEVEKFSDLGFAARATVDFINRYIITAQRAKTIEQIADAYNSGNFRDLNVPTIYIARVRKYYDTRPLPSATVVA